MVELLGPPPTALLERGKYSHDYFGADGRLLAGGTPSRWPLEELLQEKYGLPAEEVRPAGGRSVATPASCACGRESSAAAKLGAEMRT